MVAARRRLVTLAAAVILALSFAAGIANAVWRAHVTKIERAKAAQRSDQIREVIHAATQPGSAEDRTRIVQDAVQYLDSFSQGAIGDRASMREVAEAYERIAAVQDGITSAGTSLLSSSTLGDTAGALASRDKAISLRERIAKMGRNNPADMQALAEAYIQTAESHIAAGSHEAAAEHVQNAIPIGESLLASHPTPQVRLICARAYLTIARALSTPGGVNMGNTRTALAYMRGALKMQAELVAEFPKNLEYQHALVATYRALATVYSAMDERDEELEHSRNALRIARSLAAAQPENSSYRRELAAQLGNLGTALMQQNENAQALGHFREALAMYDAPVAPGEDDAVVNHERAIAHRNVAVALGSASPAEASRRFQQAVDLSAALLAKHPENRHVRRELADTWLAKSRFELVANDPAAAIASAREGVELCGRVIATSPAHVAWQKRLATLLAQLGASHAGQASRPDEAQTLAQWQRAKEAFARSLAIYEQLKANDKLSRVDLVKPEQIALEIAKCETALTAQASSDGG